MKNYWEVQISKNLQAAACFLCPKTLCGTPGKVVSMELGEQDIVPSSASFEEHNATQRFSRQKFQFKTLNETKLFWKYFSAVKSTKFLTLCFPVPNFRVSTPSLRLLKDKILRLTKGYFCCFFFAHFFRNIFRFRVFFGFFSGHHFLAL